MTDIDARIRQAWSGREADPHDEDDHHEDADSASVDDVIRATWRGGKEADRILMSSDVLLMLVVRRESVAEVCRLYGDCMPEQLAASDSASVEAILRILRSRR